jgi:hypothetical protein
MLAILTTPAPAVHPRRCWRRLAWGWLLLSSAGTLAWVPFLYAGIRGRRRDRLAWAGAYFLAAAAGFAAAAVSQIAGGLILIGLLGVSCVHAFVDPSVLDRSSDDPPELQRAAHHARLRALAQDLAERQPARARELGVGRPDLEWSFDGGLVDVNSAPASVLGDAGGLDEVSVQRLEAIRDELGGFASLAELDFFLDLSPRELRQLSAVAVFLPA